MNSRDLWAAPPGRGLGLLFFASSMLGCSPSSGTALRPDSGVGCSAPQTLCWDFEQGMIPEGWSPSRDDFNGTLVVDATKAHRGMYSLHAKDFSGGTPGQQGGPKKTITYALPANFGPVLWGRAFVFTTPAAPDSHAGLFNARYPPPNSTATAMETLDWYEVATFTQKYMAIWHPPEPPGYPEDVLVSETPAVVGKWVCLEWLFDGANGTASEAAQPRMWVDGTELTWPLAFTYPDGGPPFREKTASFTELETGIYLYQGLTQVTNWWIDDLGVGPRRIGCN